MFCGCDFSHGRPAKDSETLAPDEIVDFKTLYAENCAGCHGAEGRGGAAIALGDPVYLARNEFYLGYTRERAEGIEFTNVKDVKKKG